MSVATVGCGRQAAFGNGHIEVADAVAEAAISSELGRLQQLAASEDDLSDMDEELGTVMTDLESPTGVAEVRAVERHAGGLDIDSHGERRVLVARAMVVTPDDGNRSAWSSVWTPMAGRAVRQPTAMPLMTVATP